MFILVLKLFHFNFQKRCIELQWRTPTYVHLMNTFCNNKPQLNNISSDHKLFLEKIKMRLKLVHLNTIGKDEALWTRKIKQRKSRPNETYLFCLGVEKQCEKKKEYLKHMATLFPEDYHEYNDTGKIF